MCASASVRSSNRSCGCGTSSRTRAFVPAGSHSRAAEAAGGTRLAGADQRPSGVLGRPEAGTGVLPDGGTRHEERLSRRGGLRPAAGRPAVLVQREADAGLGRAVRGAALRAHGVRPHDRPDARGRARQAENHSPFPSTGTTASVRPGGGRKIERLWSRPPAAKPSRPGPPRAILRIDGLSRLVRRTVRPKSRKGRWRARQRPPSEGPPGTGTGRAGPGREVHPAGPQVS